jgi:predicted CxxxxCH...CXXCH cytochrome family protein
VPASWDAEGHILRAGAVDEAPAEVRFAAAGEAAQTPEFASRSGEPAYDAATGECSNVYCHGDALADSAASNSRPSWSAAGTGQAECGTCHGDPPATHAIDSCATCHPVAAPHIDGALAIGNGPGCAGCHGSDATGAPPRDLSGNEFSTAIGVGAHQSHLTASMGLRGPLACSECHTVPAQTTSPGHIDSATPAEVAMVGGGAWVRETATCESWCHGDSRPVWTRVGRGEVYCGSCHDIRPAGHDPELALTDCVGCHAETVDPFGNILRSGPPGAETSEHMDGEVDADVE